MKLPDGSIDLSGVWLGGGASDADVSKALKPGDKLIMLPWAEQLVKTRKSKEDPVANCLPAGVPRGSPYPWRIVPTPTHYFILFEGNIHSYRQVFMNAKHPDDPDPTWYGHSVGHCEGGTLVVDTIGFNDKFWFDYVGHPHTEKLHAIERYTRTDLGHMSIEVTIDDPGAYKQPFTTIGRATLMVGKNSWSTSARKIIRIWKSWGVSAQPRRAISVSRAPASKKAPVGYCWHISQKGAGGAKEYA